MTRLNRWAIAAVIGLVAGLGITLWLTWSVSEGAPKTNFSIHGIIALVGGIVLTIALGVGLMAAVYYSARHGYDERADGFARNAAKDSKDDA